MTRRTKLGFDVNKPTTVELLFDEPIIGESTYGPYAMYALEVNGMEYSFFAPPDVHAELSKLKKGDKALVTKIATQKGSRVVTKYDIQIPTKVAVPHKPKSKIVSLGEAIEEVMPDIPQVISEPRNEDISFQLMKDSYSDSLEIISDLNGMTSDIARIAITLFIQRSKTH